MTAPDDPGKQNPPPGWLTRDQLAAAHDVSRSTLDRLWSNRDANGHPAPVRYSGVMHWDSRAWGHWHTQLRQTAAAPAEELPRAATSDEEIGVAEFARILGHKDNSWVSKAVKAPPAGFPAPDSWGDPDARKRPRWRRHRAETYARTRHLQPIARGRRAGTSLNDLPYPYARDPRLTLARQVLAEHPDARTARLIELMQERSEAPSSASTWTKILTTARQHPTPEQ